MASVSLGSPVKRSASARAIATMWRARSVPPDAALLRVAPGITLRWVADTAAVSAYVKIYND
jgi:hypothetical protein